MSRYWYLKVILSHLFVAVVALQVGLFRSQYRLKEGGRVSSDDCRKRIPNKRPQNRSSLAVNASSLAPPTISKIFVGATRVGVTEFGETFDVGSPLNGNFGGGKGTRDVLFLYNSVNSNAADAGGGIPLKSLKHAVENCTVVKHLITTTLKSGVRNSQSCLAIVGQRESYHISKWVRLSKQLEPTGRYDFPNRMQASELAIVPPRTHTSASLSVLKSYLSVVDDALHRLKPTAKKVADAGNEITRGSIIVLVCSFGHAELFVNFVCAARSVGMDLSKVLLFATDEDTFTLARSLGVTSFYHEMAFASIPRDAPGKYGDRKYAQIMMGKVYCVHLVSQLGYNILFQDVDIVPYQANYLEMFITKLATGGYDIYFQNDFTLRANYAPWMANSGCYYAINNVRTKFFFSSMVLEGDKVLASRSHQEVMHAVLSEHASQFGLRIKTLHQEHELIPMGWHFHRRAEFMKAMIANGKKTPLSFHMNWNDNKQHKQQFLEQMGDWYVLDACAEEKALASIIFHDSMNTTGFASNRCCSVSPLIRCHYRDKPSAIPCKESPPFHANKPKSKSFW